MRENLYKYALAQEKHELANRVFSEFTFDRVNLASYKTKDGYSAVSNHHIMTSGSEAGIQLELFYKKKVAMFQATPQFLRLIVLTEKK